MEILSALKISIKKIFKAHWPDYLATHRDSIPDYVIITIEKMLSCRDPEKLGYHKYACPNRPDQYIDMVQIFVESFQERKEIIQHFFLETSFIPSWIDLPISHLLPNLNLQLLPLLLY